jgi:GT2 family glycosyltransferase
LITIYHNTRHVTRVVSDNLDAIHFDATMSIVNVLMRIALQFQDENVTWCHQDLTECINWDSFPEIMHHRKIMVSYSPSSTLFLGKEIGYIEDSPFINVNKKVNYTTWQMNSAIGCINSSVLLQFKDKINEDKNFNYFLNSLAKIGQPLGLLCYSEPKLLKKNTELDVPKATAFTLFRFVKQHYKTRWLFLLLLNLLVYEKRLPLLAFLNALSFKCRKNNKIDLDVIHVQSIRTITEKATIDVIIPTIGRKNYLFDVLKDLTHQTHMPKNVIIVEQNPQENSFSELDFLHTEKWPFIIKHTFTHQPGACNARNMALSQVESEWVFLNDDDNRFEHDLIEKTFENIKNYGNNCVTNSYLQPHEKLMYKHIKQSSNFGSGNSFVKSELLRHVSFDMALEYGYGEDTDFGMQIRNSGIDVIYFPNPSITHLKAPMGGFRIKPKLKWHEDSIQPKPSPTIMYVKQKYDTQEQILGYKIILFFKYYRVQKIINPFRYFVKYKKQWKQSEYWANQLKIQNEV